MRNLLLVDLSNLMYKYLYIYPTLSVRLRKSDGVEYNKPTGHIYGAINVINQIARTNPDTDVVIAIDGMDNIRKQFGIEYKERTEFNNEYSVGENTDGRYNVHVDSMTICTLLSYIPNVSFILDETREADDIIYSYIKDRRGNYDKIGIFSEDRDLLINVDEQVVQFNKIATSKRLFEEIENHTYWDLEKVKENFYGTHGKGIIYFKCYTGDTSDSIVGYPRFIKAVAGYMANYTRVVYEDNTPHKVGTIPAGDLELKFTGAMLKGVEDEKFERKLHKWLGVVREDKSIFMRNYKMVQPYYSEVKRKRSKKTVEELRKIANTYKLKSYIQNVINWDKFEK